jgi:hypothetical protein
MVFERTRWTGLVEQLVFRKWNRMFEKLLTRKHHISPHRIWAFLTSNVQLDLPEYVHMLMCGECHEFSEACLKAGSFGEALGNWLAEHDIEQAS